MFRRLVERLSRRVILRRRWPAELGGGHIYVSPDAMLKVWTRSAAAIDEELLLAVATIVRPGNRVWDVGSNLGIFAFAAAHRAGPSGEVYAVEADTWLVNLLRRTARARTAGAPVKVLPVAITRAPGIVQFNIAERGRASNFAGEQGQTQTGGVRERQQVIGVSLDWLMEQTGRPDAIKVDVEGMESDVLRGAARVLAEARPRFYIEVADERTDEVTQIFRAARYSFFRFDRRRLIPEDRATWNTVAIPDEQVNQFAGPAPGA